MAFLKLVFYYPFRLGMGMQTPMAQNMGSGPTSGPGPRPTVSSLASIGATTSTAPKLNMPLSQERLGNRTGLELFIIIFL